MILYPYASAIILNDSAFVKYGGQTGTFTLAQREAAYLMAEQQATRYIGTLLQPTVVTGTYSAENLRIATDYGYVNRILSVTLKSIDDLVNCGLDEDTACAFIWDDTFGYLDVSCVLNACGCPSSTLIPYQIRVAYEAGLPTGTSASPPMLMGLTLAAQIILNEIAYPSANESTGDVGVTQFGSMDYSEVRKPLRTTAFGNSAKSQMITKLIDTAVPMKARRALFL